MTVEILFLAIASTIRPTSLAAVYAMLSTERARRFLIVYIASGLAFTVGFGMLAVWAFHGATLGPGSDNAEDLAEIIGGVVLLAFAGAMLLGLIGGDHTEDAPRPGESWGRRLEQGLTVKTAAIAGPATHIPGLFYLVAINVVVGNRTGIFLSLFEILLYNLIWFAIPFAALAVCMVAPEVARERVGLVNDWARTNSRSIVITVSIVMGSVFVVLGALSI
ncbi:MAG: GAP family protein [Solirubrobacterales bacterium]|nr:GAP family protein [Solirubrobacterales bacterium]